MANNQSRKIGVTKTSRPNNGFISVIALGIFALLAIFAIIVQITVMDSVASVKNTKSYYAAQDVADSVIEYLQGEVAGWEGPNNLLGNNGDYISCDFVKAAETEPSEGIPPAAPSNVDAPAAADSTDDSCSSIRNMVGTLIANNNIEEVTVELKVKGKAEDGDNFPVGSRDYFYTIPAPGTGTAGENCDGYDIQNGNINDACNWNKLEYGSNLTDRVAIPLYTNEGSPFQSDAEVIGIRVRTPCNGSNNSSCTRYVLTDSEEAIVQWQFSGLCGTEYCTFFPYEEEIINVINSKKINDYITSDFFLAINEDKQFINSISHEISENIINKNPTANLNLIHLTNPVLSLFLVKPLKSNDSLNIPYLEYQIVTDAKMGLPTTEYSAIVKVDGNIFVKKINQQFQKGIIDFAVQN